MGDLTESTAGNLIAAQQVTGSAVYNGKGEKQHPLPWATLHYDERLGGYVVKLDRKTLQAAPSYQPDDFKWTPEYGRQVDTYYNVPSYWL